ncbi:hypothetical protein [Cyanothece sp. BG0011]|uniref:hypothetical protein n=1 Tax=Cyanothece sp. BG0011 TaxID=2082950 RepID=UPI000D1E12C7|nr:hypothetical protein [Cyanothece sp. BG0011]
MIEEIRKRLDVYDSSPTECDGMTRICSTILTKEGIKHQLMLGSIIYENRKIEPHFWINLANNYCIDYRLRMWFGKDSNIPHGVFNVKDFPRLKYQGNPINWEPLSPEVLLILTLPFGEAI